jgi:hypothetical protein
MAHTTSSSRAIAGDAGGAVGVTALLPGSGTQWEGFESAQDDIIFE